MHSQQFCFLPVSQHFFSCFPSFKWAGSETALLWVWKRKLVFRTLFFKKEMFLKLFTYLLLAALDLRALCGCSS